MYPRWKIAAKYLHYYLTASNGRGHGTHSPFVYEFIKQVLNDRHVYPVFAEIAALKEALLKNHQILNVEDFGGGSVLSDADQRSVSEIARYASATPAFGRMLFRMARHYRPDTMLELGTSLGLSTAFLAFGNEMGKVTTIEGSPAVSESARKNFQQLGLRNITCRVGNFDTCLMPVLSELPALDLVFIDGNHRKEPMLRYYEILLQQKSAESAFIFHDIHWSKQMEAAWAAIRAHPQTMLSVDLFFGGIVFFSRQFKIKQHFVIRS